MKKFIIPLILVSTMSSMTLWAQNRHDEIKKRLATPSSNGAVVNVNNKCDVVLSTGSQYNKINGYRVRIYFGNSQNSRSEANAARERFSSLFPGVPTAMNYSAPYFNVTAGNYLTREEAVILLGRVLGSFPNAFVVNAQMPIGSFTTANQDVEISGEYDSSMQ